MEPLVAAEDQENQSSARESDILKGSPAESRRQFKAIRNEYYRRYASMP
jgi:hypothetical protein